MKAAKDRSSLHATASKRVIVGVRIMNKKILTVLIALVAANCWPDDSFRWPTISDQSRLLRDAARLCSNAPPAEVDILKERDWPQSIAELTPFQVIRCSESVIIGLSTGPVGRAYLVAPDKRCKWPSAELSQKMELVAPGIFRAEIPTK